MDKDWSRVGAVKVRFYNGEDKTYDSLDEAVRRIRWDLLSRRKQNGHFYRFVRSDEYIRQSFIATFGACEFRDDLGLLIPEWRIAEAVAQTGVGYYCHRSWRTHSRTAYRRDPDRHDAREKPLPCWRRKSASTHWRSMAARRDHQCFLSDEDARETKLPIKARTNHLWDSWRDERCRSDWTHNCWKRHRATQYKDRSKGRS